MLFVPAPPGVKRAALPVGPHPFLHGRVRAASPRATNCMSTPPREEKKRISASEFATAVRGPYRRLFGFLGPYRGRFAVGLLAGALYGALSGLLIFAVDKVTSVVLPKEDPTGTVQLRHYVPPPGSQYMRILRLSPTALNRRGYGETFARQRR